jgi:dephospho-CoA kinase
MLKVGITGEMGSGKTYISNCFAEKGVPVYNCDKKAKILVVSNDQLKEDIKKYFGENIYDGNVFKNLSSMVFATDEQSVKNLKILGDLIYPYLYKDIDDFCKQNDKASIFYCLIESAILYENNMEKDMDAVIYVSVDADIRMKRAMERDKITADDYKNRMKTQINPDIKKSKANYIIYNDGKNNVRDRIKVVHDSLQNTWIFSPNDVY